MTSQDWPPPPPPPPPPGAVTEGPSTAGYWVAGAMAAVGVIGAVVLGFAGLSKLADDVDDFARVPLPGGGEVSLADAGEYTVYYEGPGAGDADRSALGRLSLDPVGGSEPAELRRYEASLTYTLGDHSGRAVMTFEIKEPGAYLLTSSAKTTGGGELAVGRGIGGSLARIIGGSLILLLAGVGACIAVAIVTAGRRRAARRALYPSPVYQSPPPRWSAPAP